MELQGYAVNYIGDIIKNIKVFMNEAMERNLHNNTSYKSSRFKVLQEESDSIYLSIDELMLLNSLEINEDTILKLGTSILNVKGNAARRVQTLINARDRFLIGAFTGLRFQDYNTLTGLSASDDYITNRNQKTSSRITIPMHVVIRQIIIRRNGELPPPVSNQKK